MSDARDLNPEMNPEWRKLFLSLSEEEWETFQFLCVSGFGHTGSYSEAVLVSLEQKGLICPNSCFEQQGVTMMAGDAGYGVDFLTHFHWCDAFAHLDIDELMRRES